MTATATATAGLSGCFGSDDNDTNSTTNDSDNGNGNPGRDPQEAFDEAITRLQANAERLNTLTEVPGGSDQETDQETDQRRNQSAVDEMNDRLETARTALDEAAENASGDLTDQIGLARDVLEFQDVLIESHALELDVRQTFQDVTQDQRLTELSDDPTEIDASVFEDITEGLGDVETGLTERLDLREDLESTHQSVDTGALDADGLDYSGTLDQYLRYSQTELEVLQTFVGAYADLFDGIAGLVRGIDAFDSDEWSDAADSFTGARETLQQADFQTVQDSGETDRVFREFAPNIRAGGLITLRDSVVDALDTFVDAAESGENGNVDEARATYDEAISQLEEIF